MRGKKRFLVGSILCLLMIICLSGCKDELDSQGNMQPAIGQEESISETESENTEPEEISEDTWEIDPEFVEEMILVYEDVLQPIGTATKTTIATTVAAQSFQIALIRLPKITHVTSAELLWVAST